MIAIRNLHEQTNYTLKLILTTLGFPKSTYHYHIQRLDKPDKDQEIKEEIKVIRQQHKDYGYRRICAELHRRGYKISRNKVQRLMQAMDLQVTTYTRKSRKYNSYKGEVGVIAPHRLKRRFMSTIPYQKIVTDTTEFKYYEIDQNGQFQVKKLYLDPYLDLFNVEVISYKISRQPNKETMLAALDEAIVATNGCEFRRTFHADQGWAYQMKEYRQRLKDNAVFQSMSRKGNCLDNAPMENFFSLMKQEMYHGRTYHSYEELEQAIHEYIRYYNEERIKEKLGWLSPMEYKQQHASLSN